MHMTFSFGVPPQHFQWPMWPPPFDTFLGFLSDGGWKMWLTALHRFKCTPRLDFNVHGSFRSVTWTCTELKKRTKSHHLVDICCNSNTVFKWLQTDLWHLWSTLFSVSQHMCQYLQPVPVWMINIFDIHTVRSGWWTWKNKRAQCCYKRPHEQVWSRMMRNTGARIWMCMNASQQNTVQLTAGQ